MARNKKPSGNNKGRFTHSDQPVRIARNAGAIKRKHGDHYVVEATVNGRRSCQMIPEGELDPGIGRKIWRWYKLAGLIALPLFAWLAHALQYI